MAKLDYWLQAYTWLDLTIGDKPIKINTWLYWTFKDKLMYG